MRTTQQWLDEYSTTHQNPLNQRIHRFTVPLIFWSMLAMVATLPPVALLILTPLFSFYFTLGWTYGFVMVFVTGFCLMVSYLMMIWGWPVFYLALAVFVLAWSAQFYGHRVEGKKPTFLNDILFLLIGPLWTLDKLGLFKKALQTK
jgi:uncharacterized membrane protein YGL010W